MQYRVDYAITIVFIIITIHIPGTQREKLRKIIHRRVYRPREASDCHMGYHKVLYKIPLTLCYMILLNPMVIPSFIRPYYIQ